jgi:transglutaminase-like putative cysteine protease
VTVVEAPPPDPGPMPSAPPSEADRPTAAPGPTGPRIGGAGVAPRAWVEAGLLVGSAVVAAAVFTRLLPAHDLVGRILISAVVAAALSGLARRLWAGGPPASRAGGPPASRAGGPPASRAGGPRVGRAGGPRNSLGGLAVSAGASLVAYVVTMGVLLFPGDTWLGLPTPSSTHAVVDAVTNGVARIVTSAVPTPPVPSSIIVALTVAWLVAWAGCELAARVRSPLLPALPGLIGFAFALLLGGPGALVGLTTAFVAIVAALGVLRASPPGPARSASPDASAGRPRQVLTGLALVVTLALVTALVGLALGVSADQADLHRHHQATQTFAPAITPLSQIQGQLLARPPTVQFQVTVAAGAVDLLPNWRLTVLDHFDGSQWSTPETFVPAGGVLPAGEATTAPTSQVTETITVNHLSGVWLPTAGRATRTSLNLVDVGTTSGSLARPGGVTSGLTYRVSATVAQYPADLLAGATPSGGGDDTELPATAPADLAVIRGYVALITRKATTPAAKLALIERYLLTDHFDSTPESDSGQSYARIADFLHRHRSGTSEQFATTFALMARILGYPARVAVGFRRGLAVHGRITVTSADAYAWPEVHFADLGWVPFDPTPEATGAAAAGAPVVPVTTPGPAVAGAAQLQPQTGGAAASTTPGDTAASSRPGGLVWAGLALLAALAVAAALAVVGLKRRRTRRRRRAVDPTDRVIGAWHEALDQVRLARVTLAPSLTNSEVVSTAWIHLGPEVGTTLGQLRTLTNRALFAEPHPGTDAGAESRADQAWAAADEVSRRVQAGLRPARRVLAAVDPRPLRVRPPATG